MPGCCQICVNMKAEELASANDGRLERLDLAPSISSDSAVGTGTEADMSLLRQRKPDERTPLIVQDGAGYVLSLPMRLKHTTNVEARSHQTGSVDHHYQTQPRPSSCVLAQWQIL
jgi:hypothetical protein